MKGKRNSEEMDEAGSKEKICAYCRQAINSTDEFVNCRGCGATLHLKCWQDNTGCNTFACNGKPVLPASLEVPIISVAAAPQSVSSPTSLQHAMPRPVSPQFTLQQAISPPTPLQRAMPQVPIWAPNPAVPLVARVLAYFFAFMMLFTAFLSFTSWRPVSVPDISAGWEKPFTSSLGYSTPYPKRWKAISREEVIRRSESQDGNNAAPDLFILPSSEINIYVIPISADDISPSPNEYINLKKFIELPYNDADPKNAGFHEFTFVKTERHGELFWQTRTINMHGSWTVRNSNTQQLLIVGGAPEDGWKVMSGILSHMVNDMSVTK